MRSLLRLIRRPAKVSYDPHPDGRPDPGEVVWGWVAYEDDPNRGKDRPVLLIARGGDVLYGLMLTGKDHDRRPSEVRLDRLIEMATKDVRREGAALDRATFDRVVVAVREHHAIS